MKTLSSFDLCGDDPRSLSCEEVSMLKVLAVMLGKKPVIVNIGAEHGVSTLAMLEEKPEATIYSVDVNPCDSEFENIRAAGLDPSRVTRVLGRSQEVEASKYAPIDLLFVDGDHRYDPVKSDIANWVPHVKFGGIVAFHDYIREPIPAHIHSRVVHAVDEWASEDNVELISLTHRLIAFRLKGKNHVAQSTHRKA